MLRKDVKAIYGNKVRVRACGMYWEREKILLVNHGIRSAGDFWAPPGGGIEFGQSIEETVKREFREETGLNVQVGQFLFGCEFLKDALHSIELFFEVVHLGGDIKTGTDPELQIIKEVKFMDLNAVMQGNKEDFHGLFRLASTREEIMKLSGFYRI